MVQNVRVRRLLIVLVATVTSLLVAAVGVDFGGAIYAEYRWSRVLRAANGLAADPWVGILGFPFATQAADRRFREVEVRASGVDHPVVGTTSLEATLHTVTVPEATWLITAGESLGVGKVESRIIVDSTHLGRYMGIDDLLVEAPSRETNDATGGTTESGISDSRGLVFTGTPIASGFDEKVSIAVDLTIVGADRTTVVLTPTGVLTGPNTADQEVPDDVLPAVLAAFTTTLPGMKLPFGIAPTSGGARGSDVIVEGIAEGVSVPVDGFRQS